MFKRKPNLSDVIEAEQLKLLSELEGMQINSTEYKEVLDHITNLETVKIKKTGISKDAMLSAAASLAGILLVLNYERAGAIVSKSFGMVRKP